MSAKYASVALLALLTAAAGNVPASVIYFVNNARFFPAADGAVPDSTTGNLTAATAVSHTTSFSTNPGDPTANLFDGVDTIDGSPFEMNSMNSVTINQATDSSLANTLSLAVVTVEETGVTVTGGSGTGYLLPTFRFVGSSDVSNTGLAAGITTCVGNNSCTLAGLALNDSGGFQSDDLTYTPAIDSTTSFQFGTPFDIFYSLDADALFSGAEANPGTITADYSMQLVSIEVVNADGSVIRGAQINSQLVDLMRAPEPPSGLLCIPILLAGWAAVRTQKRRPKAYFTS